MDNPAEATRDLVVARDFTVTNLTAAQTRLDEAWRALRREVPSLETRLASGELDVNEVIDTICAAAMRVLRNPDAHERESAGVDDYTETWQLADASADLYFTAAELRRLQPIDSGLGAEWSGSLKYC